MSHEQEPRGDIFLATIRHGLPIMPGMAKTLLPVVLIQSVKNSLTLGGLMIFMETPGSG